jgi:hypothetical protein
MPPPVRPFPFAFLFHLLYAPNERGSSYGPLRHSWTPPLNYGVFVCLPICLSIPIILYVPLPFFVRPLYFVHLSERPLLHSFRFPLACPPHFSFLNPFDSFPLLVSGAFPQVLSSLCSYTPMCKFTFSSSFYPCRSSSLLPYFSWPHSFMVPSLIFSSSSFSYLVSFILFTYYYTRYKYLPDASSFLSRHPAAINLYI